jgi:hypothetical protein
MSGQEMPLVQGVARSPATGSGERPINQSFLKNKT